jgi:adenine-specific DNA-methyltransferase
MLVQRAIRMGAARMTNAKLTQGDVPGRLALIRSVRGLQKLGETRGRTPTLIVGTVLRRWSLSSFPELRAPSLRWSRTLLDDPAVVTFEKYLKQLSFEDAAYWLSTAYTALSPAEDRKRLAMYFTPPPIANRLLNDLADEGALFDRHSFMDPACGGAAFLAIVADRMRVGLLKRKVGPSAILRHANAHLAGIDIDKTLCALSRHFLRMVFYREICSAGWAPQFNVKDGNSLTKARRLKRRFDVVVCNPPYRKLSRKEADLHRAKYVEAMQGQPNLYALFIQLTTKLTRTDGIVGLVTPTSFLSGQNFSALRTFLLNHASVKHIGIIQDRLRVYFNVEQDTALTTIRPGSQGVKHTAAAGISVVDRVGKYSRLGKCNLSNSGSSWPLARGASDMRLLEKATKSTFRLANYGYKPTIGGFVWNRDTRKTYEIFDEVPEGKREGAFPLLWASDLRPSGRLNFDANKPTGTHDRYVVPGKLGELLIKKRPAVLLQRVTASDQMHRLTGAIVSESFVAEHGGFVGENHVVILEQDPQRADLPPTEMLSLLKTAVINRYFNCVSGCTNVSVFELQQLPLPDPKKLKRLLDAGVAMEKAVETLLLGYPARMD